MHFQKKRQHWIIYIVQIKKNWTLHAWNILLARITLHTVRWCVSGGPTLGCGEVALEARQVPFHYFPFTREFKWWQPWDAVDTTAFVTWTKLSSQLASALVRGSRSVVFLGVSSPTAALTTRDACLLGGNTLDLKPFLCPQAGYLCYTGSERPGLNCTCPEPADTGYNGGIDVLLRNPWVRIKELLASQQGQRESVWTLKNVFLLHPACPQRAVALLASCKKKRERDVKCDITCQIYVV